MDVDLIAIADAIKDDFDYKSTQDRWSQKRSFQVCLVNARLPLKVIFLVSWPSSGEAQIKLSLQTWKWSPSTKPKYKSRHHQLLLYVIKALLMSMQTTAGQLYDKCCQPNTNLENLPFTDVKTQKVKGNSRSAGLRPKISFQTAERKELSNQIKSDTISFL